MLNTNIVPFRALICDFPKLIPKLDGKRHSTFMISIFSRRRRTPSFINIDTDKTDD